MRSFRKTNLQVTTSESISESQSAASSNNDSSSGAVPVNLTTQRLQDWKAFLPNGAPAVAGGE
eukprot:scaffold30961_cov217-Skeletonema_menzelii.AAC.1